MKIRSFVSELYFCGAAQRSKGARISISGRVVSRIHKTRRTDVDETVITIWAGGPIRLSPETRFRPMRRRRRRRRRRRCARLACERRDRANTRGHLRSAHSRASCVFESAQTLLRETTLTLLRSHGARCGAVPKWRAEVPPTKTRRRRATTLSRATRVRRETGCQRQRTRLVCAKRSRILSCFTCLIKRTHSPAVCA